MATRRSGKVVVQNGSDMPLLRAVVMHRYGDHSPERFEWLDVAPGSRADVPMRVQYSTGEPRKDWWIVGWQEPGDDRWWFTRPPHDAWKQHNLGAEDDGQVTVVTIRRNEVEWSSPSGTSTTDCLKHQTQLPDGLDRSFAERQGFQVARGAGDGLQQALLPTIRKVERVVEETRPVIEEIRGAVQDARAGLPALPRSAVRTGRRLAVEIAAVMLATFAAGLLIWKALGP